MPTHMTIHGGQFYINGKLSYEEFPKADPRIRGLLWNQRLIQGVLHDKANTYYRAGIGEFEPEQNTEYLIRALPAWYACGLRAFTVGFQGGCPVGLVKAPAMQNNPFSEDGTLLDPAYAGRMCRIIEAADRLGLVVIVSLFYWAQTCGVLNDEAVRNAVLSACRFLKGGAYTNVILEIANEYNIPQFAPCTVIHQPARMAELMRAAREASGGVPAACSPGGGMMDEEVIKESDVVLVHGNGLSRGEYYDYIRKVQSIAEGKPVVCNEDSPCISRIGVALETGTSWGYYNNYTKQIPPVDYGISRGEDLFFARRMARSIGILESELPLDERFVLQGFDKTEQFGGQRVIRLAAEFPEEVDCVDFYRNGTKVYRSFDEPFFLQRETTWLGTPKPAGEDAAEWIAVVYLASGGTVEKNASAIQRFG